MSAKQHPFAVQLGNETFYHCDVASRLDVVKRCIREKDTAGLVMILQGEAHGAPLQAVVRQRAEAGYRRLLKVLG